MEQEVIFNGQILTLTRFNRRTLPVDYRPGADRDA